MIKESDRSSPHQAESASSLGWRPGPRDPARFTDSRSRPPRIPPAGWVRTPRARRKSRRSP